MAEISDFVACIVVCDAGPLIHLDELGCLDLLGDFPEILVPGRVWMEVERHRPSALSNPVVQLDRIDPVEPIPEELASLSKLLSLDAGELEALQIVREKNAGMLLCDDSAARFAAASMAIEVHGTIGILLRSIRRGIRSTAEISAVLRLIPKVSTLHIKQSLLEEFIERVEAYK